MDYKEAWIHIKKWVGNLSNSEMCECGVAARIYNLILDLEELPSIKREV